MRKVDVAIIGAGTSGLSARREVAKVTENYVVIDDGPLGTTCARVGCMPSKVLIQSANDFYRRFQFSELGIQGGETLKIDRPQVWKQVRKLRDRFVKGVRSDMKSWENEHLVRKHAIFLDSNTLKLTDPLNSNDEEKIQAKSIVIATGSRPIIPKKWEEFSQFLIDSNEIFELENPPESVAVIGLGVIGIELGQALSRLGIHVVGFGRSKRIGGLSDPRIQEYAATAFGQEFELAFGDVQLSHEGKNKIKISSGEKSWSFDRVLLTMGRTPNIDHLGFEALKLPMSPLSIPNYDSTTFQIPNTRLFIAGDVNADRAILHEAADEGRIAGYNAVRDSSQCFKRRQALAITFCDPNIAVIGKSFQQLKNENTDFITGKVSFEGQGRAIVMRKEKGLLHVFADRSTDQLLGAEMMAPSGEHLAHLLAWAIELNLRVDEVLSLPFYHPVVEEGLRTALRDAAKQVSTPPRPLEVLRCEDPPAGSLL